MAYIHIHIVARIHNKESEGIRLIAAKIQLSNLHSGDCRSEIYLFPNSSEAFKGDLDIAYDDATLRSRESDLSLHAYSTPWTSSN
jgi:hypothetical protein